ncbi:MAG: succinylglutamate desuccinylase/aspartoacylase family protein [Akkermansiaceae bacterium]
MAAWKNKRPAFELQGQKVEAGTRSLINLPVGVFTNNTRVDLSVVVVHGRRPGPTLLVTGCIHGDEINGAEIIRRLLKSKSISRLKGTLLVVPIVNVPAFLNRSRYLPDRRDLNRLYPGSAKGSLGARLAKVVSSELLPQADIVIDLHTGTVNRPNLPQIRVTVDDQESIELAKIFNAPVTVLAPLRNNSFRSLCREEGKQILLFESGEALRLDAHSIRYGVQGIVSVMRQLGMLAPKKGPASKKKTDTVICTKTYWERATIGGLFTPLIALGKTVEAEDILGFISDPFGGIETPITANYQGVVIGRTNEGLADEGDALFHIALFGNLDRARDQMALGNQGLDVAAEIDDHPVPDEPFIEDEFDMEQQ